MTLKAITSPTPLDELLEILARLRHPMSGSPWEREQTHASIAPNVLEEAYEVVDAIKRDDIDELKGELGDLLLQVVFQSQIARESGHFTFQDVAQGIVDKIKARLPHFFAGREVAIEKQLEDWDRVKQAERDRKGYNSVLDGVAQALPALVRSQKLQERAARVGYTWPTPAGALAKVEEEWAEVKEAVAENDREHIAEEIGDTLASLVNLARMMGIDAEAALRSSNQKFERRFRYVEGELGKRGSSIHQAQLQALIDLWNEAKSHEAR